jgi:hypothetical protein
LKRDPGGTSALIVFSTMLTRGITFPRPRRFASLVGFGNSVPLSMLGI